MLALTKPRFFMPVHGEYKHLKKHCDLAAAMGVPRENMVIGEIGRVVELSPEQIALGGTVPSGSVMVDGRVWAMWEASFSGTASTWLRTA